MEKTTVEVERAWLESLLEYGNRTQEAMDKDQNDRWAVLFRCHVASLLGFVSSAKVILKYK